MLGREKKEKKVYKCSLSLSEEYLLMRVTDIFGAQVDCDVNSR